MQPVAEARAGGLYLRALRKDDRCFSIRALPID